MKLISLFALTLTLTACSLDSQEQPSAQQPASPATPAPVIAASDAAPLAAAPVAAAQAPTDSAPVAVPDNLPAKVPPAVDTVALQTLNQPTAASEVKVPSKSYLANVLESNDLAGMDDFLRINPDGIWSRDESGKRALHHVRSAEMAEKLWNLRAPRSDSKVKRGELLHLTPDDAGNLPLHTLIREGQTAAALYAVKQYCPRFLTPEFFAGMIAGRVGIVAPLINTQDAMGRTALHLAALRGDEAVVEALLACGYMSTAILDAEGNTPLDLAFACKRSEIAFKLVAKGATRVKSIPATCGPLRN